jgi:hypothetical protein
MACLQIITVRNGLGLSSMIWLDELWYVWGADRAITNLQALCEGITPHLGKQSVVASRICEAL